MTPETDKTLRYAARLFICMFYMSLVGGAIAAGVAYGKNSAFAALFVSMIVAFIVHCFCLKGEPADPRRDTPLAALKTVLFYIAAAVFLLVLFSIFF